MITLTENTLFDKFKQGAKYAGMVAAPAALGLGLGHLYGAYDTGESAANNIAKLSAEGRITPEDIQYRYGSIVDPKNMSVVDKMYVGNKINNDSIIDNQRLADDSHPLRYYTSVDTSRGLGGLAGLGVGAGAAYLASRNNNKKQ